MRIKKVAFAVVLLLAVFLLLSGCGASTEKGESYPFALKCDYGVHEEGPEAIRLFGDPCISPWDTHLYPLRGIDFSEVKFTVMVETPIKQSATLEILSTPDGKDWRILWAYPLELTPSITSISYDLKLPVRLNSARALEFAVLSKTKGKPQQPVLIWSSLVLPDAKRSQCHLDNRAVGSLVSTFIYRKVWIHDLGCQVPLKSIEVKVRSADKNEDGKVTVYYLTEDGSLSRDWVKLGTFDLPSMKTVTHVFDMDGREARFFKIESTVLTDYSWVEPTEAPKNK